VTIQEAKEIQETKSRCESNSHQIAEIKTEIKAIQEKQDTMHEMNTNIKLIAQGMSDMQSDFGEVRDSQKQLADKVASIENRPSKETYDAWSKIKVAIATAIGTGLVAYGLSTILK